MAKFMDVKAIVYPVTVLGEKTEVTIMHTSNTVFEAHGTHKGISITAKGGSRAGAMRRWRHLAERSED
jgi:hypothetical protein